MSDLTKQLAVGRLVQDDQGKFMDNQHQIIASLIARNDDGLKNTYADKLTQIMNKANNIPDKRIRLTTNDKQFEVQVLAHQLEKTRIVFFAITDPRIGESYDIADILQDFKKEFLNAHSETDILKAKPNGKLHKKSQTLLRQLIDKYGTSKLYKVQKKVDDVKNVMNDNMEKALNNVMTIETMEAHAAEMENNALGFKKKAVTVKREARKTYYKTNLILAAIIIVIILIIVAAICGSGAC